MISLIALCGLAGSGKSTLGEYLNQKLDIPYYHIGQILIDECRRMQIEATQKNKKIIGVKLGIIGTKNPLDFFMASYNYMRLLYPFPYLVLFDALRSHLELEYLYKQENVLLIGVCLDKDERYRRLGNTRKMSYQQILARDLNELGLRDDKNLHFNLGVLLGLADLFILTINDPSNPRPYDRLIDNITNFIYKSE